MGAPPKEPGKTLCSSSVPTQPRCTVALRTPGGERGLWEEAGKAIGDGIFFPT